MSHDKQVFMKSKGRANWIMNDVDISKSGM